MLAEKFVDSFPSVKNLNYSEFRDNINSGDILLCSGNSLISNIIKKATSSRWSHVAFIIKLEIIDRIMVLESVESLGVRAIPLSNYVNNYNGSNKGYDGKVLIARHSEFKQEKMVELSRYAVDLLGSPYHPEEFFEIAARIGERAFHIKAHNIPKDIKPKKSFICSEYAAECYQSVGINIPYNPSGFIAPADFARDPKIKPIAFINICFN